MKLNDLIQYPQSERTRKKINEILRLIFENNIKNKKQKFYEKITAKLENSSNENTGTIKIQLKTFFATFEIKDGKIVDMFFRSRKYKKKTYSFISLEDIKKMKVAKEKIEEFLNEK